MFWAAAAELMGKPVRNGCGALLGSVVQVVGEPDGGVKEIVVRQSDGSKDWFVETWHIKHVADEIVLKGPREGYHIAPLAPLAGPLAPTP